MAVGLATMMVERIDGQSICVLAGLSLTAAAIMLFLALDRSFP